MNRLFGKNTTGLKSGVWRAVAAASVVASGLFTVAIAATSTSASATTPALNFIDISPTAASIQYDGTGTAGWSNAGSPTTPCSSNGGVNIPGSNGLFNCGKAIGTQTNPFPVTNQAPTFTAPANSGVFSHAFLQNQVSGSWTNCSGVLTPGGNQFGGGEKFSDDPASDSYSLGPVTGKDEISNVYAVARQDSAGQDEVYVGLERTINNGDTHADFQFLQEPVAETTSCSGNFASGQHVGHHAQGDVVLEINFDNGGANPTPAVLVWSCTGSLTATPGTECSAGSGKFPNWVSEPECPTSTPAAGCYDQGAVAIGTNAGATSIPCGAWVCKDGNNTAISTVPQNEFMEGAINLDALNINAGCAAYFFPLTRAAGSADNSQIESFAQPTKFQTCANTTTTTTPLHSSIQLGQSNTDSAVVTSSFGTVSPQGNVTFYACGPTTAEPTTSPACSPSATNATSLGTVHTPASNGTGSSTVTSPSFTPTQAGWYCFDAEFAPDAGVKVEPSSDGSTTECFDVTPITPGFTTAEVAPQSTAVGNTWGDLATVTGTAAGGLPTGSVTFSLCKVDAGASTCTGGQTLATVTQPTSQTTTTATYTLPAADDARPTSTGIWCFNASYTSSSANYSSVAQQTDNECFTVTKADTGTATTVSPTVVLGPTGTIHDTVTVTGNAIAGAPTGSVTFYLCQTSSDPTNPVNGPCPSTGAAADTEQLSPNPAVAGQSTATTKDFTPTSAGSYCFGAVYSGDSNYNGSADNTTASNTNSNECVTVTKAGTNTSTVVYDAASGSPYPASGEAASTSTYDTSTVTGLAGGPAPTGTVIYDFYPTGDCSGDPSSISTVAVGQQSSTNTEATAGSYGYKATYNGDTNYLPSTGSCESFIVLRPAAVSALKTEMPSDPAVVDLGGTIQYTIALSNTGQVPAPVTVKDTVPAGTTFDTALNGGTYDAATNQVTWSVTVPAASSNTSPGTTSVSFSVKVNQGDANGLNIPNYAYFTDVNTPGCTTTTDTPSGSCNTNTVVETVKYPVITASKASTPDDGASVMPGATIVYSITVTNSGLADADNVVVTDPVPAGTTYDAGSAIDGGQLQSGDVVWTIPVVHPGTPVILTFSVTVDADDANGTTIPNTAYFTNVNTGNCLTTGATPAGDCNTNTVTQTVKFPVVVASKSSKPGNGATVAPGDDITYTITVTNTGLADAQNVVVNDTVPAGTDYQSSLTGTESGGVVTWTIADLAPGASVQEQFTVAVDMADQNLQLIKNAATYTDFNNTPVNGGNGDSCTDGTCTTNQVQQIVKFPIITAVKASNPGDGAVVSLGDTIAYTITLTNTGYAPADDVAVTDAVPLGTTFQNADNSGSLDTTDPNNPVVDWTVTVPAATDSGPGWARVSFTVKVNSDDTNGEPIQNVALFVNHNTPGCDAETCPTNTVTQTVEFPIISATKSQKPDSGSIVSPGSQIIYTVTLSNAGLADAKSVPVTDTVPTGTTFVSATDGGTLNGNVVSWTVPLVPAGSPVADSNTITPGMTKVSFTVTVDQGDNNGQVIPNVAQYSGVNNPNCDGTCDTNQVTATVEYPVVTATKQQNPASGSPVRPGDSITYTVALTNSGLVDATNLTVTDPVPAGTTFSSAADGGTYDPTSNTVTWTVADVVAGTLPAESMTVTPGTPTTVSFTVTVNADDTNQQVIPNVAHYSDVNTPSCAAALTCDTNQVTAIVVVVHTSPGSVPSTTTTTKAPAAPTTTAKPKSGLAFTGSDIFPTIGAGLLLGGCGGLLVLMSRKRQRRQA